MAKSTQKKIVYVGPIDLIEVPMPDGTRVHVARNQELDTTPAHAAWLLEQESNWQPSAARNKKED